MTFTDQGPTLILASSSPRRQELVRHLGLPVLVRPSDADEWTPAEWPPARIVEELAERKARTVWDSARGTLDMPAVVIGSDTIVAVDGDVLGKPKDEEDAARMLSRLAGRSHEVFTGVCCIGLQDGKTVTGHRRTVVRMRELTAEQILRYIASGEPLDKAGAYGIQGLGAVLVDSLEGCYFNVVGLPLSLLADQLESFGVLLP
ncbi:septum formation inhibitor Maf [Cohnella sp. CFH 77786]|uniref:Maf family protein n=1 Tax=Cohnella sp. CFH 77786 TaxID=2662265 RepID=UPI001C60C079|nr:Maf family protein [Cohnella sp. CFH 77786]MBW5447858.1 septum formation inhibitor Maf [Cohnella sp. CFH 77786]